MSVSYMQSVPVPHSGPMGFKAQASCPLWPLADLSKPRSAARGATSSVFPAALARGLSQGASQDT